MTKLWQIDEKKHLANDKAIKLLSSNLKMTFGGDDKEKLVFHLLFPLMLSLITCDGPRYMHTFYPLNILIQ